MVTEVLSDATRYSGIYTDISDVRAWFAPERRLGGYIKTTKHGWEDNSGGQARRKWLLSKCAELGVQLELYPDLGARTPLVKRPELQRLLRDLESGVVHGIAVQFFLELGSPGFDRYEVFRAVANVDGLILTGDLGIYRPREMSLDALLADRPPFNPMYIKG